MQRESRATLRDPFTVTILIAVPLAALLAFGYTLATDVQDLRLGRPSTPATPPRAGGWSPSSPPTAPSRPDATPTRDAIDRALVAGEISVAVVIPPDFDRHLGPGARPGARRRSRCSTTAARPSSRATRRPSFAASSPRPATAWQHRHARRGRARRGNAIAPAPARAAPPGRRTRDQRHGRTHASSIRGSTARRSWSPARSASS